MSYLAKLERRLLSFTKPKLAENQSRNSSRPWLCVWAGSLKEFPPLMVLPTTDGCALRKLCTYQFIEGEGSNDYCAPLSAADTASSF